MNGYLVDTDIWINILRGVKADIDLLCSLEENIGLSAYTLTELLSGYRTKAERKIIKDLENTMKIYPITRESAALAGELLHSHRDQGIGVVDATNVSICLINDMTMVSRNRKHYQVFQPELNLYQIDK